jgi:hypothetical protein
MPPDDIPEDIPVGMVGEVGVGCKGGRDMRVDSLDCGGVVSAGEGFGSAASGFAGTAIEGSAPRVTPGVDTGVPPVPGLSAPDWATPNWFAPVWATPNWVEEAGRAATLVPPGGAGGADGSSGLRLLNTVAPFA